MAGAHGGQPVRLVFTCILRVADANERGLHEADEGGEHLGTGQALQRKVMLHPLPDDRQCIAEVQHVLELGFIADLMPPRMIAALLAPAHVAPGGLQMAVGT